MSSIRRRLFTVVLLAGLSPASFVRAQSSDAQTDSVSESAATQPQFQRYRIRTGDTLSSISQNLLGSFRRYKELLAWNPRIKNPDRIRAGRSLRYLASEEVEKSSFSEAAPVLGRSEPESSAAELPSNSELASDESPAAKAVAAPVRSPAAIRSELDPDLQGEIARREVLKLANPTGEQLTAGREQIAQSLAKEDEPADRERLRTQLALMEARAGDSSRAAEIVEEALRENPKDAETHLRAARFYSTAAGGKQFDRALNEVRLAQAIEPDSLAHQLEELSIARASQDQQAFRAAAQKVVSREPAFINVPGIKEALRER